MSSSSQGRTMGFREKEQSEKYSAQEDAAMRRAGLRRRREHHACLQAFVDDSGEVNTSERAWYWHAVLAGVYRRRRAQSTVTGGLRDLRKGKEAPKASSYRPGLFFLAQALLTFVGIVVIPARLFYEVLITRPEVAHTRSQGAVSSYVSGMPDAEVIFHQKNRATSRTLPHLVLELTGSDVGDDAGRYGDISTRRTSGRSGSRVLLQSDEEEEEGDSFTYSTKTQFNLCVHQLVNLTEDDLRANVVDVFGVDESQIDGDVGEVTQLSTAELCTNSDIEEAWSIAVGNEADEDMSAAAISAEQMELVRSGNFAEALALSVSSTSNPVSASDFTYNSLGYVILYDADQSPSPATESLGSDFYSVLGPDQWWPWWAFLLVAIGFLFLCCCAICIYRYRPRPSDPPSPSGTGGLRRGGSDRKFGSGSVGSSKDGVNGGINKDYLEPEFNKDFLDKDFDKATAISMDSPMDYMNTDPSYEDDAPRGNLVDVHTRQDQGSAWPLTSATPSEADIAAGLDPGSAVADSSSDFAPEVQQPALPSYMTTVAEDEHSLGKGQSGRSLGAAAAALVEDDLDSDDDKSLFSNASVLGSSFRAPGSTGLPSIAAEEGDEKDEEEDGRGIPAMPALGFMATTAAAPAPASAPAPTPVPESGASSSSLSRRSSFASSRGESVDVIGGGAGTGADRFRLSTGRPRASSGSELRDEMRELTNDERTARMLESDAARAASERRGSSTRISLQPDLERKIAIQEQVRRREAVKKVDQMRAPGSYAVDAAPSSGSMSSFGTAQRATAEEGFVKPSPVGESAASVAGSSSPASTTSSVAGKVLNSMSRIFGMGHDAPVPETVPEVWEGEAKEDGDEETEQPRRLSGGYEATGAGVGAMPTADALVPVPVQPFGGVEEGKEEVLPPPPPPLPLVMGAGATGVFGSEEKQAYSDKVDRTLRVLPDVGEEGKGEDGTATMPLSELLARAELEAQGARPARVQGGGISLEQIEESLASPIVATPPALLRPGVGAARGANSRGRGLLNRQSASGSYVSSRSTSITEDMMSNQALTEDDMSSDAHTTDVSRTSSYLAGGSSFEEGLAQAQAGSGHFQGGPPQGGGGGGGGSGSGGAHGGALVSSLAEHLARAEETVGREHEKGLLYRQGPEGVAAAVAGELPGQGGGSGAGAGGAVRGEGGAEGDEKIESLADMLKRADDGPGNLKETFRMLDEMETKRLEDLSAAASAEGADDETKARWRGSLAELMLKADRSGNLREALDLHSAGDSAAASEGTIGQPSERSDSTAGSGKPWWRPEARPE